MLSQIMIQEVIDAAMKKYAVDNDGKIGLTKKDVIHIANEYGGDSDDVRLAMAEALMLLSPGIKTHLS